MKGTEYLVPISVQPLIFETMNSVRSNYLRVSYLGSKDGRTRFLIMCQKLIFIAPQPSPYFRKCPPPPPPKNTFLLMRL